MHEIAEFEPRVQCAVLTPIEGCRGRGCAGGEIVFSPISIVVRPVVRQSQSHRRSVRATASLLHVGILDTPATRTRPGSRRGRRDKTGRKMPARCGVGRRASHPTHERGYPTETLQLRSRTARTRRGSERRTVPVSRYPTPGPPAADRLGGFRWSGWKGGEALTLGWATPSPRSSADSASASGATGAEGDPEARRRFSGFGGAADDRSLAGSVRGPPG